MADLPTSAPGVSPDVGTFVNDAVATAAGDVNAGFVLNSAYLVFFMHCGFAMVGVSHFLARPHKVAVLQRKRQCVEKLLAYPDLCVRLPWHSARQSKRLQL